MNALEPALRSALDATPIAHLATVLPDGAPHCVPVWIATHRGRIAVLTGPGSQKARNLRRDPRVAVSLTAPEDPSHPLTVRGRVVDRLEGEDAWPVVDEISRKYTGRPYPRGDARIVVLIEPNP